MDLLETEAFDDEDERPRGDRPVLTFPPKVEAAVRAAYAQAGTILEYGSGGSTVLAGDMPGKTVYSVESDGAWVDRMRAWFAGHPPASTVHLHHVDIGPTMKWGRPVDTSLIRRWPDYSLSVWDRPDFVQPDVVLIDGRFRAGCFLATALRTQRPVTVLFDDYKARPRYRAVEDIVAPVAYHGRMAEFRLASQQITGDRLAWAVRLLLRPQ
ncbi:MAG: hypothetical protein ACK4OP_10420 [Gemmobacter sp.]